MNFLKLDSYIISKHKSSINDFFERNYQDYNFFHPHEFSYMGLMNELLKRDKDYFVFLMDTDIIMGYGMLRGWSEGYETPALGIMIDLNHRGKGLSMKMMEHLHQIAIEKKSRKIRLTVYKQNNKAIDLYNKLGYQFADKNTDEYIGIKDL